MTKLINIGIILVNVALAVSGQVAIKIGMKQIGYITSGNTLSLEEARKELNKKWPKSK